MIALPTSVTAFALSCVLPVDDVEAIVGDLEEEYASRDHGGWWYSAQVLRSAPRLLWSPIQRSGCLSTLAVAIVACAVQAIIEVGIALTVHASPAASSSSATILSLTMTLLSLAAVSYRATRARPGAATAVALIVVTVLAMRYGFGGSSVVASAIATQLGAIVTLPLVALAGGALSLKRHYR